MESENLTEISTQKLERKIKQMKTNKMIDASFIGFTIGIVIYSAVNNGFELFTFFPLILAYLIARNSNNNRILEKELLKELKSRDLT